MLKKMTCCLLACVGLSAMGVEWILNMNPSGNTEILLGEEKIGEIRAVVFRPNWQAKQFTVITDKTKELGKVFARSGHDGAATLDLTMAYEQKAPNAVSFSYSFKPQGDMEANSINAQIVLETAFTAGRAYETDNEKGVFPVNHGDIHLLRTKAGQLTADTAFGKIGLKLDGGNTLLIQDNRRWSHQEFEIRMSVTPKNAEMSEENVYGWKGGEEYVVSFTVTFPEAVKIIQDGPVVMKADGETWIPLVNKLEIEKGSAIDFTDVVSLDGPAGKYGWTKAVGQNFEFENLPGKPQRFYGVNLCMAANILTHEQSDILADRLARFGYNTLRYHHHENHLIKNDAKDSTIIDPKKMDQFDYLFAALKKRGIYFTTDVYVSRDVRAAEIYPGEKGNIAMDEFKNLLPVNAKAMESWKTFARNFLWHKNPYTGLTLAEDPALNLLSMVNEGVISGRGGGNFVPKLREQWLAAFNQWLTEHYTREEMAEKLKIKDFPVKELPGNGTTEIGSAFNHCRYDLHQKMYQEMTRFLREELHSKALFTDMNNSGREIWAQCTRSTFDYVDDHFYVDHPRFLQTAWRLPSICENKSVIKTGTIGGAYCAFIRNLNKPMTITEWNYCGPGKYRGIGGIVTGCLATQQNWAGLWRFTYSHSAEMFKPNRGASYFDLVADPLNQLNERAIICLYLRGDMMSAEHTVALTIDKAWAADKFAKDINFSPTWYGYSLVSKVGVLVDDSQANVNADVTIPVTPNAPVGGTVIRAKNPMDPDEAGLALEKIIRDAKWLPEGNRTDLKRKIFQTANNQFMIDGETNSMVLNTLMTAGGFAEKGGVIKTDVATFSVREADATVWVSSVTKEPIATSRRMVLNHVTELHNTNQLYGDRARKIVQAWGMTPHILRNGAVDCELKLAKPEEVTVYRLDVGGKRLGKVATAVKDGKLCFELRVKSPDGAQLLYELVRQ